MRLQFLIGNGADLAPINWAALELGIVQQLFEDPVQGLRCDLCPTERALVLALRDPPLDTMRAIDVIALIALYGLPY